MHLSTDIFEKLKTCFLLERAAQIYCYALILCANGFLHIDQVDDFYQESFLSVLYRRYSFKMGIRPFPTCSMTSGLEETLSVSLSKV